MDESPTTVTNEKPLHNRSDFLWLNSSAHWENSVCKLKTYLPNHKLLFAGLKEINFPLGEEGWAEGQEYLFIQTHTVSFKFFSLH